MKIGDLVKIRFQVLTETAKRFPHFREIGLVVGWDSYHPVVQYSDRSRTMAKNRLVVVSASR